MGICHSTEEISKDTTSSYVGTVLCVFVTILIIGIFMWLIFGSFRKPTTCLARVELAGTEDDFKGLVKEGGVTCALFYDPQCPFCRQVAGFLDDGGGGGKAWEQLKSQNQGVNFIEVQSSMREMPEWHAKYAASDGGVGFPTLVCLDGESAVLDRKVGAASLQVYQEWLGEVVKKVN